MSSTLQHYASDDSLRGPATAGSVSGAAGGAPCGDLVRISLAADEGVVTGVSFESDGCAATRAAAAATAEEIDAAPVLEAARLGSDRIGALVGGLAPAHAHAADLAADALGRALGALASSGRPIAPPGPSRVLIALSGGVDSAVAALLEREGGREVVAVTLKLWADRQTDGERSCCSPEAVVRARSLAHSLGIPHLTLDLEEGFRATVVEDFLAGYAAGSTPNPCVRCNGELRIDAMIALAGRLGAEALATGHYARMVDDGEGPLLVLAADDAKDQTYMLSGLAPESIARLRFPLGELTKPEVREFAGRAGLPVASRPESQDLCFLAGQRKADFLRRHAAIGERPGEIVDADGRVLGTHSGHHNFTIGQRRGLGVSAPTPLFVLGKDPVANRVVVGSREQLACSRVRIRRATLHREGGRVDRVRLRYHARPLPCRLDGAPLAPGPHGELELTLQEPARALAPGQTASLMEGDRIVGHGTIA